MFENIVAMFVGEVDPSLMIAMQLYLLSLALSVFIVVVGLVADIFDHLLAGVEGAVHGVMDVLSIGDHVGAIGHTDGLGSLGIGAFFASFGASGIILTGYKVPMIISAPISAIVALTISVIVLWICVKIFSESTITTNVEELVGQSATVTVRIPAGGVGEVTLAVPDGIIALIATSSAAIDSGKTVTINKVVGSKAYVQEK